MWRVKVCGLTRLEDAECAWEEGADALGFVLEPSSPRVLQDVSVLTFEFEGSRKVAVFGEYFEGEDLQGFDIVQAFGADQGLRRFRMPVFRPRPGVGVSEWLLATQEWDCCLLDPFHPGIAGGTGETVNWELAARFVEEFSGKVILAGGLGPENVREAIRVVKPFGVDASSRLEVSPGVKDLDKVGEYVREAWAGLIEVHGRSQQDLWDEAAVFRNG